MGPAGDSQVGGVGGEPKDQVTPVQEGEQHAQGLGEEPDQ